MKDDVLPTLCDIDEYVPWLKAVFSELAKTDEDWAKSYKLIDERGKWSDFARNAMRNGVVTASDLVTWVKRKRPVRHDENSDAELDDLDYGITSDEERANVRSYVAKRQGLLLYSGDLLPNARKRITDAVYSAIYVVEHYAKQGLFQNPQIERWLKDTFNKEIDRLTDWYKSTGETKNDMEEQ